MGYLRRKTLEWLPAIAVAITSAAWHIRFRYEFFDGRIWMFEGLCREIVAGTTEGRQALVGSGWHPPLPLLVGAPAAACAPAAALPWAAIFATALATAVALYTLNRTLGRCLAGRNRGARFARVMAWLLFAACCAFVIDPIDAVVAATGVVAVCKLAEWWESGGMSDLVKLAFAIAALALCGFATAGIVLALLLLMPLPVLWNPRLKGRFSGVFVLGALPGIYALAVWCLMCWLILGDGFYTLRGVAGNVAFRPDVVLPIFMTFFIAMPTGVIILRRHDPMQCAIAATLLLSFVWLAAMVFSGFSQGLSSSLYGIIGACFLLTLARAAGQSPLNYGGAGPRTSLLGGAIQYVFALFCGFMVVILASACLRLQSGAIEGTRTQSNSAADLLGEIRADVAERTPYGRVFVCGYSGQELLRGARPEPFTPCLDPYIDALRKDYERQQIFLLMPRPDGADKWESLYWRYPGIFRHGAQGLLFARDFGTWRLYELVSAPMEEQLEEWREK